MWVVSLSRVSNGVKRFGDGKDISRSCWWDTPSTSDVCALGVKQRVAMESRQFPLQFPISTNGYWKMRNRFPLVFVRFPEFRFKMFKNSTVTMKVDGAGMAQLLPSSTCFFLVVGEMCPFPNFPTFWELTICQKHPAGLETDLVPHQLRPSCNCSFAQFWWCLFQKNKTISSLFPMVTPKSLIITMQYGRDRCCDVSSESSISVFSCVLSFTTTTFLQLSHFSQELSSGFQQRGSNFKERYHPEETNLRSIKHVCTFA